MKRINLFSKCKSCLIQIKVAFSNLKGPIPSVLVSFYNVNQMPIPLELIFTVKPQGLHVLLSEIQNVFTYYVIPC